MNYYIVKSHPLLNDYTCACVHKSWFLITDDLLPFYDTCNYRHVDEDNLLYAIANPSEDDLLVLTLSGCIVERIVSEGQLDKRIFNKLKTMNT